MKPMRKALFTMAVVAIFLAGCKGKTSKEEAAKALEATEIMRIDSVTTQIDSIKNEIDSSAKEVDELIMDL
jgi:PBP1b-binding outer membrane lipoprotein LpoB